jgi:hypothetical protein
MAQQQSSAEVQQYVRWSPHRSPYAIELKLELVPRLITEIAAAEKLGIEVGGILIGTVTAAPAPTLRIEEFELVPRDTDNGTAYMLDPGQRQYLAGLRAGATARGASAIGFFRSHLRPGPLRPSLADRSLLIGQFKDPLYVVLLVEAREPRMGAFFLAFNGQLSVEPAVQEFRFGERALSSAREIRPNLPGEKYNHRSQRGSGGTGVGFVMRRYGLFAVLLLIALATGVFSWPLLSGLLSSRDHLDLAITGSDRMLKISWNHGMTQFSEANNASLVITDGASHRMVDLGPDELKAGTVAYERRTQHVQAIFTVNMPGSTSVSQSAEWQGD